MAKQVTLKSTTFTIVNPEDRCIWNHLYAVGLSQHLPYSELVYANTEAEALDTYADYAQEQGWLGLFLTEDDVSERVAEFGDEVDIVRVGNSGLPVNSWEANVKLVK